MSKKAERSADPTTTALENLYKWVLQKKYGNVLSCPEVRAAFVALGEPVGHFPARRPRAKKSLVLYELLKWVVGPHRHGDPFSHVEMLKAHVALYGEESLPKRQDTTEHRIQHRAPGSEGAPLWDLTQNGVYPKDVYDTLHHYGDGGEYDVPNFRIVRAARGNAEYHVWMYRAVPAAIGYLVNLGRLPAFREGDWVSVNKNYAKDHAMDLEGPGQDGVVVARRVRAKNLFTDGNSLAEWGYVPG